MNIMIAVVILRPMISHKKKKEEEDEVRIAFERECR